MEIKWEDYDSKWKWAAMDQDGEAYLYANKPILKEDYWSAGEEAVEEDYQFAYSSSDSSGWNTSLISRNSHNIRTLYDYKGILYDTYEEAEQAAEKDTARQRLLNLSKAELVDKILEYEKC